MSKAATRQAAGNKVKKKNVRRSKINKDMIGTPLDFRHIGHIGSDTGTEAIGNIDPAIRLMLDQMGVSETTVLADKETATFISDFIDQHGGLDTLKKEQEEEQRQELKAAGAPPPPPLPTEQKAHQHVPPAPPAPAQNTVPQQKKSHRPAPPPPPAVPKKPPHAPHGGNDENHRIPLPTTGTSSGEMSHNPTLQPVSPVPPPPVPSFGLNVNKSVTSVDDDNNNQYSSVLPPALAVLLKQQYVAVGDDLLPPPPTIDLPPPTDMGDDGDFPDFQELPPPPPDDLPPEEPLPDYDIDSPLPPPPPDDVTGYMPAEVQYDTSFSDMPLPSPPPDYDDALSRQGAHGGVRMDTCYQYPDTDIPPPMPSSRTSAGASYGVERRSHTNSAQAQPGDKRSTITQMLKEQLQKRGVVMKSEEHVPEEMQEWEEDEEEEEDSLMDSTTC